MSTSEPNADMQFPANMPPAPMPPTAEPSQVPTASQSPEAPHATSAPSEFTVIQTNPEDLNALRTPEERSFSTSTASFDSSKGFDSTARFNPAVAPSTSAVLTPNELSGLQEDLLDEDSLRVQRGLTRLDPLTKRPRVSSIVLCLIFALAFAGAAFGVYWLGVQTMLGQSYDDIVFVSLTSMYANNEFLHIVAIPFDHTIMLIVSAVIAALGLLITALRKRWWLFAQMALLAALAYACTFLKGLLPRPYLINTVAGGNNHTNTAPSGHTILMTFACVLLFMAVSRAWRALVAAFGAILTFATQVILIMLGWHRASDVMMSVLLVASASMLALAFTRVSGMDEVGKRRSSASVQIVATVFICAGLCALAYATYGIWQLLPGLDISSSWTDYPSTVSAFVAMGGLSVLVWGLLLMMRHLTAAPLSKIGLVGAPPAPPRR